MYHQIRKYIHSLIISENVEDRLKAQVDLGLSVFVVFSFGSVFYSKLKVSSYFGPLDLTYNGFLNFILYIGTYFSKGLLALVSDEPILLCMALITFIWYWSYKDAVKTEIDVLSSLFSNELKPTDYNKVTGKRWLPFISIGIVLCFLTMAASIDNPQRYIIIMLLLAILDLRGNTTLRDNLTRYLFDARFHPSGAGAEKILEKREVAADYWIRHPHCERIGLYMIIAIGASLVENSQGIFGVTFWPSIPYMLIMAAIVTNETIIHVWRYRRDKALGKIDGKIAAAESR